MQAASVRGYSQQDLAVDAGLVGLGVAVPILGKAALAGRAGLAAAPVIGRITRSAGLAYTFHKGQRDALLQTYKGLQGKLDNADALRDFMEQNPGKLEAATAQGAINALSSYIGGKAGQAMADRMRGRLDSLGLKALESLVDKGIDMLTPNVTDEED